MPSSLTLPTTVVLHLGAHKTASTHLQHSIIAAKPFDGVAFVGPRKLRGPGESLPERFGFTSDLDQAPDCDFSPADALLALSQGADRLVLSEEAFVGTLQRKWGQIPSPLYIKAGDRVASLAQALKKAGGPDLDLCLGIRNPTDYLGSAYSQILNGNRVVHPDTFRDKNSFERIDWVDYCMRLRAVSGVARLTVWRFEDYTARFDQICQAMMERRISRPCLNVYSRACRKKRSMRS